MLWSEDDPGAVLIRPRNSSPRLNSTNAKDPVTCAKLQFHFLLKVASEISNHPPLYPKLRQSSFKNIIQRVHAIPLSESVLESIRPFIHLPRIQSNGILCFSFVFIPNIFSPSKVDHSVAPILAIPPTFGFVHLPLGRERGNRTWLSEDVAFVYGSLRPCSLVETIEEAGAFLSEDLGKLS